MVVKLRRTIIAARHIRNPAGQPSPLEAGRSGAVIIRNKHVEVTDLDKLLPGKVAQQVSELVPFEFHVQREHTEMWRRLGVRPATGAVDPFATDAKYCLYNQAVGVYVYTPAWVKLIVKEIGTVEKYRTFFGRDPRMKVTALPHQTGPTNAAEDRPLSQTA